MTPSSRVILVLIATIVIGVVAVAGLVVVKQSSEQVITPIKDFPVVSQDGTPTIDPSTYILTVNGTVNHNLSLTLAQIKALPSVTETEVLRCVSGPTGVANWTGVTLKTILDMAEVSPATVKIVFFSADDFSTDLTVNESMAEGVLVCYQMDDQPLPPEQGFPIRIVVPDHWGYKWAKWVTNIRAVDYDYIGFWESRGWSDNAVISGPTDWYYHSFFMTAAGAAGGLAGVSGYINGRRRRLHQPLFLDPKLHRYAGYAFIFFVTLVFLWWTGQTIFYRGAVFYTFHGRLALAAVSLGILGLIAGMSLNNEHEKARWWHSTLANAGYLIFLLTIAAGVLLAY